MSASEACDYLRFKIRDVAITLALRGLSAETVRACMRDMVRTETEHALEDVAEQDRRRDAEERADDWAHDAAKDREDDDSSAGERTSRCA